MITPIEKDGQTRYRVECSNCKERIGVFEFQSLAVWHEENHVCPDRQDPAQARMELDEAEEDERERRER